MAVVDEVFVGGRGDFVVVVGAGVVVDRAVGAFDHPTSRLDDEPVAGFWPGDHFDGDTGLGRCGGDSLPGVAVVHLHVADGRRDRLRLGQQRGECSPVLQVSWCDDSGDQRTGRVVQHVGV